MLADDQLNGNQWGRNTKKYPILLPIAFILTFGMNLFLVLKGTATRGANNWIDLGFFKLQPSELAKPTMIICLSLLFEKYYRKLKDAGIGTYILFQETVMCLQLIWSQRVILINGEYLYVPEAQSSVFKCLYQILINRNTGR